MIARNSLSAPSNIFYAMFYKTVDAQRWFSFAGNTLPTLSNIFYAMLCKNCRRIALVSFCRKRTSLTERILPETHFLRPVVFFIQCYLKIVDEQHWFSFAGHAFLLPETHFFCRKRTPHAHQYFLCNVILKLLINSIGFLLLETHFCAQ